MTKLQSLPPGWGSARIGDICQLINGRAFKPTDWVKSGLPIVRIQNLNNPSSSFNYFDGKVDARFLIDTGELLFAWSGTPGTSFGAHVWDGGPAVLNQHIFRVIVNEGCLDKSYVRYALNQRVESFIGQAHGGVGLGHITKGKFEGTDLVIPPLNEQRRIVTKLESLLARSSSAKEALDAIPTLLERFRQSVLAAAFRGDLTRDWREANPDVAPASKLLEQIRSERRSRWEKVELERMQAKGKVPKDEKWKTEYKEPECNDEADTFGSVSDLGWVVAPVEGLCDPNRGVPYGIVQTGDETVDGVPTVRCGDLKDFGVDLAFLKRVAPAIEQQYARTRLAGGEVLLAIRGTVGGVAVASEKMRGMNISREVAMLPVLPGVDPRFVMYLLASPAATELLAGRTKGVAQQGVNLSDLRSLPVPLPSLGEQAQIVRRIDAAMARARAIARVCAEAVSRTPSLEAAVLAKAFRGELVPQDPADEPASALLERIRAERNQPADSEPTPRMKRHSETKVA
ncbi:restriction endonuclease subunit S [Corallococcus exercitus]|uniref:restriction endonuclease subunit S n=1 Tax=Corallococcus exercitus TaxID=2316736 RepID=UPI0035D42AD2